MEWEWITWKWKNIMALWLHRVNYFDNSTNLQRIISIFFFFFILLLTSFFFSFRLRWVDEWRRCAILWLHIFYFFFNKQSNQMHFFCHRSPWSFLFCSFLFLSFSFFFLLIFVANQMICFFVMILNLKCKCFSIYFHFQHFYESNIFRFYDRSSSHLLTLRRNFLSFSLSVIRNKTTAATTK